VHVATALHCERDAGPLGESASELDVVYLERLGLSGRLPVWRQECARQIVGEKAA
jgi:hypothetical protein